MMSERHLNVPIQILDWLFAMEYPFPNKGRAFSYFAITTVICKKKHDKLSCWGRSNKNKQFITINLMKKGAKCVVEN